MIDSQMVSYNGPFAVSTFDVVDFVRFQYLNGEYKSQPSKGGATGIDQVAYPHIYVYQFASCIIHLKLL